MGKVNTSTSTSTDSDTGTGCPTFAFKVVLVSGSRMLSSDSPLKLDYRIGEWTQAPVGALFAFSDIDSAERYSFWEPRFAILRCLAQERVEPTRRHFVLRYDGESDIDKLTLDAVADAWSGEPHADPPHFPKGTVCYRKLKPVEVVKSACGC